MRKKKKQKRLQLSTETLRQIRGGVPTWPDTPPTNPNTYQQSCAGSCTCPETVNGCGTTLYTF